MSGGINIKRSFKPFKLFKQFMPYCIGSLFWIAISSSLLAEENLQAIVKKFKPSAVSILTYDNEGKLLTQGSGFFISQEGDVITNLHVLEGANRAEVKTASGEVYPVKKILGEDGDIIRVSVDINTYKVRPFSINASIPQVGEQVIVIGNPLGLGQKASWGSISEITEIPVFGKVIQITAPIFYGSSGSPVINMKGGVVGVATFLSIEDENLNFAIPAEKVLRLALGKGQSFLEWNANRKSKELLASAEWLFFRGRVFLERGNYQEALYYFENVVKKDPNYGDAYFYIGYCNSALRHYQEAVDAYKKSLQIKPDYSETHHNMGFAYIKLGRYEEAEEAYKEAVRINPDNAESYNNLGTVYLKLKLFQKAIDAYKQVIRINPDYVQAHYNLGLAYFELGRHEEAIDAYKQATRINPDYIHAYSKLCFAYYELGRYQEAIDAYKQVIRINPAYAEASDNEESSYIKLERYHKALEAYRQAGQINPNDFNAHYNLGLTYVKLGYPKKAIEAFKQVLRLKPERPEAHFDIAVSYLMLDDSDSAITEYKTLKSKKEDLAKKLFNLIYKPVNDK